MISEYVLLCAPYRYQSDYLNPMGKNKVEKELFGAIMPGVNIITRKLVLTGIKNNFGIVDKESLIETVDLLEKGSLYKSDIKKDELVSFAATQKQKEALTKLIEMTKGRYDKGFDDCRIIDVITKSYAGNILDEQEFKEIFSKQTQRIKKSYESWQQYLASCVIGKLIQTVQDSPTITTIEEFISDIYSYCIAPTNVFSYSTFWQDSNLENIGMLLADFMNIKYEKIKAEKIDGPISIDLLQAFKDMSIDSSIVDKDKFAQISNMAYEVLIKPLRENNLEWMIIPPAQQVQNDLLLPEEMICVESARDFWTNYQKFEEIKKDNIFAFFVGNLGVKAIFTEKGIYTLKKKLFGKPSLNLIRWSEAKLSCKFDIIMGVKIQLDSKTILEVFDPDFEKIGLGKKDIKAFDTNQEKVFVSSWEKKMNKVLSEIPQKIRSLK